MTPDRKDNDLRGSARRSADARAARSTKRAFRPLRWAWLLLFAALLAPAYDLFFPAGLTPPPERRTVVIERGQSLHEISRELQRTGVIKSQVGFLVLARTMALDRRVKAGQYSFKLGITVPALLRALDRGMYGLNLVTIPEGLMIMETARLIERHVGIPASALDSLSRDPSLLDSLEIGAPSLEGWLAPDSYEWLPGTAPEVVLRTMVTRTRERVQRATAGYDSLPLGMNQHEVLTLASIVESESRANDERPRIARAYLNRLERGMLLQADPTVGYALGRGPRSRLLFKDLRVESPYNTYRHEGLPPGPICSPGESAIQAVMNATPNTTDLYFVANGKGRHIFAPTYQKHLENIALVKSRMREAALAAERASAASAQAPAPAVSKDDDVVVGGALGDSGAVRPPSAAPTGADATNAVAPHAAPASAKGGAATSPITNLTRLPAGSAATSTTEKPKTTATTPSKAPAPPIAQSTTKPAKSALTTPAAGTGSTPLKGDLLVPKRSATVASSKPGSVEVVRKAVTPVDTSHTKATSKTSSKATKPAATAPETTPAKAASKTSSQATSTSATKPTPKPATAAKDTAKAKSSSKTTKPPAKSAPKPAAKDTTRSR